MHAVGKGREPQSSVGPVRASSYLQPAYRPDIDGLRAVAVMAVLGFHAFPGNVPGGFVGVDIFFVISGFLISSIVLRGLDEGCFSFSAFYARRIKRIFPGLIIVLGVFLALGWFLLLSHEYRQLGKHSAASAAFVSNLALWGESGYFDMEAERKPMLHLWSLGVEEQFYLIWPLLLVLLYRRRLNLVWSTALIALGSFFLNIAAINNHASATFYLPVTRMWELLAGALLAYFSLHFEDRLNLFVDGIVYEAQWAGNVALREVQAIAGILMIVASVGWIDRTEPFPGWRALLPVTGTFLLIAAGSRAWMNRRVLAHPYLVLVGLVSYPLYLWHWPLLSFARIMVSGTPTVLIRCGALVVAFILACLTYYTVEKPVRSSRRSIVPIAFVLLATAIGFSGYVIYKHDGFSHRFPQDNTVQNNNDAFTAYEGKLRPCPGSLGGKEALSFCRVSSDVSPTVSLFGDSHADHLFPGIAKFDTERGWLLIGQSGCAPLSGVRSFLRGTEETCSVKNDRILSLLAATKSISAVVLSSNAPYYISEADSFTPGYTLAWGPKNWMLEASSASHPIQAKKAVFAFGLGKTIDILERAGKKVIVYLDVPGLPFMPFDCVRRPTFGLLSQVCQIDRSFVLQQQRDYREIVSRLEQSYPKLLVFDPLNVLCPASQCFIGANASYYRDSHHLSLDGSYYIAKPFLSWLASQTI